MRVCAYIILRVPLPFRLPLSRSFLLLHIVVFTSTTRHPVTFLHLFRFSLNSFRLLLCLAGNAEAVGKIHQVDGKDVQGIHALSNLLYEITNAYRFAVYRFAVELTLRELVPAHGTRV